MDINELRKYFHEQWICRKRQFGWDGTACTPADPYHDETDWTCGWRYQASFTEETWNALWSRVES